MAAKQDHLTGVVNWPDLRRWNRFTVNIRLKVSYWKDGQKTVIYGQGSDVSEGGMAAYIPADLQKGENLSLEVLLPYSTSQEPLTMQAVVRNRNGFRYGLEYTLVSAKESLLRSLKTLELVQV